MRINVLVNAPWGPTAYSQMAAQYGPRLVALGHEVSMTAMWGLEGGPILWNGIPVFPRHADALARDVAAAYAADWKADVFMSWCDTGCVRYASLGALPWAPWVPVDSEPICPDVAESLKHARWPLIYSRFGVEQAHLEGVEHAQYLPIGIDLTVFRPQGRAEARRRLEQPEDAYVVGMVAANIHGTRKAYPQQMRAFAQFRRRHPEARLMIHAIKGKQLGGVDLVEVCKSLGLVPGRDVTWTHQYAYATGQLGPGYLATFYSACDVLLSVTQGEGFGIPIVEAAACGTPAITGDWSAMAELGFSGLAVSEEATARVWNNFDTWWWMPRSEAIAEQLEHAYAGHHAQADKLRWRAQEYDIERVMRFYWEPLLGEMEAELVPEMAQA